MLLGYGTEVKGYSLFDPTRNKVLYSCDLKFNETEFGLKKEFDVVEPVTYIELDVDGFTYDSSEVSGMDEEEAEHSVETIPRRSVRPRATPQYYSETLAVASSEIEEPMTYHEAVNGSKGSNWKEAMQVEMKSFKDNNVWELVTLPKNKKLVGSKWVYKVKVDGDGHDVRFKARLVAPGFTQTKGADYDETFCPVVRMESVRTVISLAVRNNLKLHQLDVTTAFINETLEENVYIQQPEGFVVDGQEKLVCKLNRSLYGLKQSPGCWNTTLRCASQEVGFFTVQ